MQYLLLDRVIEPPRDRYPLSRSEARIQTTKSTIYFIFYKIISFRKYRIAVFCNNFQFAFKFHMNDANVQFQEG